MKPKFYSTYIIALIFAFFSANIALSQVFTPYFVKQVDWIEPYDQQFSTTARLMGEVAPVGGLFFLNVCAKLPTSDEYFWVIKNFPIPIFENTQVMSYNFDLIEMGFEPGTPLEMLEIFYTDGDYILEMPDLQLSDFRPIEVAPFPAAIGSSGALHDPVYTFSRFEPYEITFTDIDYSVILDSYKDYIIYRGCNVPNIDLDSAANPPGSAEGYAGDKNACAPAAAANSMHWLEKVHEEIATDKDLRGKLVELSGLMGREPNSGVSVEDFIKGKLAFIDKHKLPISVKFQSLYTGRTDDIDSPNDKYGHSADNQSRTDTDLNPLSWSWLYNEMKDGEDVEMVMDYYEWDGTRWVYKGSHVATVTGVSQISGVNRIWIKDDDVQNGEGGTEQNGLTWRTIGDSELPLLDEWSKGNRACVVTDMISESYNSNVQFSMNKKTMKFNKVRIHENEEELTTTYANFSAVAIPTDEEKFVNILARAPGSTTVSLIVDNMKIYPYDFPVYKSFDFSLEPLNVSAPWDLEEIEVQISVTDDILVTPMPVDDMWFTWPLGTEDLITGSINSGTLTNASGTYTTTRKIRDLWDEILNPEYDSSYTRTVDINHGCTFTNIDLDYSRNGPDTNGYAGDENACAPAAAANSMQWLQANHDGIEFTDEMDEAREKLRELSGMMGRADSSGTLPVNFIEGKMQFIEKYRLPIKVKFQGIFYTDTTEITAPSSTFNMKAKCHNDTAGAYPEWDWIKGELEDDEDVELAFGTYKFTIPAGGINGFRFDLERTGGHKVAVTGAGDDGGVNKIKFKHDRNQSRANDSINTDTREEEMAWNTYNTSRGQMVILGKPWADSSGQTYVRVVEDVVSESYDSTVQFSVDEESIEMNQTNMLDPDEGSLTTGAYFSAIFNPSEELKYMQVFAKMDESDEPVWLIPNLPIMPFPRRHSMAYGVDLARLGVTAGDDVETMHIGTSITINPWEDPGQIDKWIKVDVGDVDFDIPNGINLNDDFNAEPEDVPELVFDADDPLRDTVYRGCDVYNIDLNDREYGDDDVEGYAGDRNACAPAAAANSLHWLDEVHDEFSIDDSLRGKLYELSKLMKREPNKGVSSIVNFVQGKLAYIDKHRLPIKVKFQSFEIPPDSVINSPDTTNGGGFAHSARNERDEDSQFPDWDWLVGEMQHGEDVEMMLAWRDSDGNLRGHAVTVTGIATTGGVQRLWIKDDAKQRREGLGRARRRHIDESGEEILEWRTDSRGRPYIRRYGRGVRYVHSIISESYDSTVQYRVQRGTEDFGQYYSMLPGAGLTNTGNFSVVFNPSEDMGFVNVMARLNEDEEPVWLIRNMPAPPFDNYRRVSYGFDLTKLGLAAGDRLEEIEYQMSVGDENWTEPVIQDIWKTAHVDIFKINFEEGSLQDGQKDTVKMIPLSDLDYVDLALKDFLYRGCKVPNIDLDSASHNSANTEGYAGDKNACGPASAANSMQWLEKVHDEIDSKITHRKKLTELSEMMDRANERGVYTSKFIKGKLKFIQKYNLPVEVKFQTKKMKKSEIPQVTDSSGNVLKASNRNTGDSTWPTWEFLKQEMKDGEDVELEYGKYDTAGVRKGGHWVTVTGMIDIGGVRSLWIKDDLRQDSSGYGYAYSERDTTGEEFIDWDTTSTGIPILKRWGSSNRRIESIVSESYKKPKPKELKIKKVSLNKVDKPMTLASVRKGSVLFEASSNESGSPLYGNVVARKPDGKSEFWILKNALIMPDFDNEECLYWFDYEMMEKEIEKIQALEDIEISTFVTESPWTSQITGVDWETIPINESDYYISDGLNATALAAVSNPVAVQYSEPDTYDFIYRDIQMYQPDLNSADDDPQYTAIYSGDEGAGGPASVGASVRFIDEAHTEFNFDTEPRRTLELTSRFSGRAENSGVSLSELVAAKLQYIDSIKIKLEVQYQTPGIAPDTIFSPDGRYLHYGLKVDGNAGGYPTWDYLKRALDSNMGVELAVQWISPDGEALAGQFVSVAGISDASGVNSVWIVSDTKENAAGGIEEHFLSWVHGDSGQPILAEWSSSDTLCYIVGIIGQKYNSAMEFDEVGFIDKEQILPEITIVRNPSEKDEAVRIQLAVPEDIKVEMEIYDIKGNLVSHIADKWLTEGRHEFVWNGTYPNGAAVSSGNYILILRTGKGQSFNRIIKW